ncbi:MAG: PD40 domain-containing protein, partial [Chitinispirillaceae bacterium]|nr:PD40 domain-containing protein [Chitinispirillaceae bacterium]
MDAAERIRTKSRRVSRLTNRYVLLALAIVSPLFGFGKNKVQYTDFAWNYLPAPRFTLYFHQDQGPLPAVSYRMTEEVYRSLNRRFRFSHKIPVPVIVYGNANSFVQTNIITELLPEEVGGFTEVFKNRVVVPFTGSYDDFNHVIHHEMVHAFQFGILYDQMGSSLLTGSMLQIPLWFMEGLAEYLSSGWNIEADMFLMDQVINANVPTPGPMLDGYMAYKGGQSFLLFLASTRGDSLFTRFLREFKVSKSVDKSIKSIYRKDLDDLGKEWLQELKRLYWPEIGRRQRPEKSAAALTRHIETRNYLNLRPRISPDGKLVAFFSDRSDYTRIIITDRTGKIIRQISQNGYGGYFESFHPLRSGMCWSPDGRQLAFVTKDDGRDQIRIVDIMKRKLLRTITTHLSSIAGPDWSHDGSMIAFAAVDSGMSDLFLYDLSTNGLRRLTNSMAAESDPRFAPGDSAIIISFQDTCLRIDDPPMAAWGITQSDLALIDITTGAFRLLAGTPWNEKQPCFSPEDGRVLFVSDRNGIDNLYIAPADSIQNGRPITDFIGGCSSPDWSRDSASIVFTLFQKQGWDVLLMDKPLEKFVGDSLERTRWVEAMTGPSRHFFTPAADTAAAVQQAPQVQKKPASDTPAVVAGDISPMIAPTDSSAVAVRVTVQENDSAAVTVDSARSNKNAAPRPVTVPLAEAYRLKFSPDLVTLGLGMSSFYGYAGQWLLSLSDIMGDHRITLAGDVSNDFESTMHYFGAYSYMKKRINLGGGAFYFKDYAGYNDSLYYFDTEFGGFFQATYPFSMYTRIDFQLLARTIDRDPRGDSSAVANSEGSYTLNTILPSLSCSFDNILWGMTGPLNGSRAEASLEVLPPFSFIKEPFVSFELDARNYLHLFKRFVWANRIFLGASQPFSDAAESPRRYLLGGNENWIFTYSDINYDQYEKNVRYAFYSSMVVPFRGWRYFDMSGTRVAVLNSEFRFPFIREFSTVFPLPLVIRYVNGAVFAD